MFKPFTLFLSLLIVGSAGAATWADPEPETLLPSTPAGHFLVHEELWNDLSDEPGNHLERARSAFLAIDLKEAADQMRKAAIYLRISSGQAAENSRQALLKSAHELEELAHRVENGTVKSVHELDSSFARALHALSHHHWVLAERSWRARQNEKAGKQLRAAANTLEQSAARTGHALQTATTAVAKETRLVAGKLVEGTGFVVDEIGKGFAKFGQQVETVGKGIEPAAPAAARNATAPRK
ncbi:MAG: hypothetical protein JSS02_29790 [Planctomycetes bacterium]|nr:hypothetical protein [Planctomycetota bacterium]